jgi:hypothetical protein
MVDPAIEPDLDVDVFDLPEWLGTGDVVWSSEAGIRTTHLLRGVLTGDGESTACDLVAVDEAFPRPVVDDDARTAVHQAWRHGQVTVATYDDRLALLVPGRRFDPELVLAAVGRMARAVGADPERWSVLLRIGRPDA